MRRKWVGGLATHIPVGLAVVFLAWLEPVLALIFGLGFLGYQIIQEWRYPNKGWYDIAGFLWGIVIGAIILTLL